MKIKKISIIWLVPVLVLSLILTLTYKNYKSQGVLINIELLSALGIIANKTKLKYKDVVIGTVEKLVITKNLHSVIASVRVDASMSKYMTNQAKFWLVKTKVSLTEVSGLETLLTGVYIDSFLRSDGEKLLNFVALKQQPLQSERKKGLSLSLISDKSVNLEVGSIVYFKDTPIGIVQRIKMSDDLKTTRINVFIEDKFSQYVNDSTLFWRMGALKASLENNKFKVDIPPIRSLLAGGIRLKTMNKNSKKSTKDNEFILSSSREEALDFYNKQDFSQVLRFVLFFKDVHGLSVGADVEYLGVKVGKVISVELYKYPNDDMKAPVVIEIYPEAIKATTDYPHKKEIIKAIEQHGLRATLRTSSLLTGDLYIVLGRSEKKTIKSVRVEIDPIYNYPVFVTQKSGLLNNVNHLLKTTETTLQTLNTTLKSGDITLKAISKSIKYIKSTSKSIQKLTDSLHADPSQLIWGKDESSVDNHTDEEKYLSTSDSFLEEE